MYIGKSYIWIGSFFLIVMLYLDTSSRPQTKTDGEVKITLFSPEQAARDESTEVIVAIDPKVTIQSVEISPPEGVSVSTIKALELTSGDKEMKRKRWSLEFSVDKRAHPGKRSVVLLTSHGRSEPKIIDIPPHVPKLSDFRVISIELRPVKVQFTVSVFDESDDFDPSSSIIYNMSCGGSFFVGFLYAEKVNKKDARNSILHVTISDLNTSVKQSTCDFEIRVKDTKGYTGRLKSILEFK